MLAGMDDEELLRTSLVLLDAARSTQRRAIDEPRFVPNPELVLTTLNMLCQTQIVAYLRFAQDAFVNAIREHLAEALDDEAAA